MLFFNANFICYYFYPTKKREEPKKTSRPTGGLFYCSDKDDGSYINFVLNSSSIHIEGLFLCSDLYLSLVKILSLNSITFQ